MSSWPICEIELAAKTRANPAKPAQNRCKTTPKTECKTTPKPAQNRARVYPPYPPGFAARLEGSGYAYEITHVELTFGRR
jgi:hypothetical protein